jgi:hypothetical protein
VGAQEPAPQAESEPSGPPRTVPPGEFVSRELESDCERFLEAVRALVRRRAEPVDPLAKR